MSNSSSSSSGAGDADGSAVTIDEHGSEVYDDIADSDSFVSAAEYVPPPPPLPLFWVAWQATPWPEEAVAWDAAGLPAPGSVRFFSAGAHFGAASDQPFGVAMQAAVLRLEGGAGRSIAAAIEVLQAAVGPHLAAPLPLSCVGSGAGSGLAGAAAMGAFRVASIEAPSAALTTLQLDGPSASGVALPQAGVFGATVHGGAAFVPSLEAFGGAGLPAPPSKAAHGLEGSVLITGGLGALGGLISTFLAEARGVRSLALLGRTGRGAGLSDALRSGSAGAFVSAVRADAALREDASAALAGGMEGLVHAGGVLADGMLKNQTATKARQAAAPKADALARLLLGGPAAAERPRAVIIFSSIVALAGNSGQVNYSAANAQLDAAAAGLLAAGLPAAAVQWGAWAELGMAAKSAAALDRFGRLGFGPHPFCFLSSCRSQY